MSSVAAGIDFFSRKLHNFSISDGVLNPRANKSTFALLIFEASRVLAASQD